MKKAASVLLIFILIVVLSGCGRRKTLSPGTYESEDGLTRVVLEDDQLFHVFCLAISYSPSGTYVIDNGTLFLQVIDSDTFVFTVEKDGSLTFVSGSWLENFVEPGTVFSVVKNAD